MGKTFIYALCDPDTKEVRYIGKSDNPKKRLKKHLGCFEPKPTHKSNWIRSLLSNGKHPALVILEEVESSEWERAEKRWIEYYRGNGSNLVNTTGGGEGGATVTNATISDKERERRRNAGRERFKKLWELARAYRDQR